MSPTRRCTKAVVKGHIQLVALTLARNTTTLPIRRHNHKRCKKRFQSFLSKTFLTKKESKVMCRWSGEGGVSTLQAKGGKGQ